MDVIGMFGGKPRRKQVAFHQHVQNTSACTQPGQIPVSSMIPGSICAQSNGNETESRTPSALPQNLEGSLRLAPAA